MAERNARNFIEAAKSNAKSAELARAKAESSAWKGKYDEQTALIDHYKARLDFIEALSRKPSKVDFSEAARPASSKGVAVICPATDWHIEETVFPEGVNGKNEYNLDIAQKRIKRYYKKVVELTQHYRKWAPVKEMWHPLLGDLITGFIHEELMETNGCSPVEACDLVTDLVCSGVDYVRKATRLPVILPCCVGNHGRTTAKRRIKTSTRNSFEWGMYQNLARIYKRNSCVEFRIADGYHNIQTIMGRKVRFHHGDGMRYGGGVGGLTIPVNKAVAAWDKANAVDLDIFGHFHTFLYHHSKWVSCGSVMGYNDFALSIKAEFQHPTQTFITIDRGYGVTLATPIFVTSPYRDKGKD